MGGLFIALFFGVDFPRLALVYLGEDFNEDFFCSKNVFFRYVLSALNKGWFVCTLGLRTSSYLGYLSATLRAMSSVNGSIVSG